jgi:hypothetical protein
MTYNFVGNEDNDPQKAQPGDHVILGVSTKGGDHSRFAGSVQQYARDGVRVLAGEQYAVSVDGKDFTRQVVEVDPETGYVYDIGKLSQIIKSEIEDYLDHKNLNLDIEEFSSLNPSAENIAILIYDRLIKYFKEKYKLKVVLYETPRNFVEYSG